MAKRRSPHGERGLKSVDKQHPVESYHESLPTRGAWIEIPGPVRNPPRRRSLPTRGAWIEIHPGCPVWCGPWSLPTRGAWIEITGTATRPSTKSASLPTRGAWIEIALWGRLKMRSRSLPTRGAWIEIGAVREDVRYYIRRSPHGERGLKYPLPLPYQIQT